MVESDKKALAVLPAHDDVMWAPLRFGDVDRQRPYQPSILSFVLEWVEWVVW